jgi:hypothetical protein
LISTAIPAAIRHYRSRQTLRADADARARLGIHFRFVDVTAAKPPITLAGWRPDRYFQPVKRLD